MSSIRNKTFYCGDDAVNNAVKLIISTLQAVNDNNENVLFDSVKEGNPTQTDDIYEQSDGVACRVYRIPGAFTDIISADKWLFRRWIPLSICPIFNLKVDPSKEEYVDDFRDNLRSATIRALSQPNFNPPNSNAVTNTGGGWQFQPIAKCPEETQNAMYKFEAKALTNKSDWYTAQFTTVILVDCR